MAETDFQKRLKAAKQDDEEKDQHEPERLVVAVKELSLLQSHSQACDTNEE